METPKEEMKLYQSRPLVVNDDLEVVDDLDEKAKSFETMKHKVELSDDNLPSKFKPS